ncbi:MAG TPA: hypothetical protein VIK33_02120 [Anaerolineae bacterium]
MTTLAIALLIGLGSFIAFIGRADRANGSGCFYTLMLGLVIVVALALAIGAPGA